MGKKAEDILEEIKIRDEKLDKAKIKELKKDAKLNKALYKGDEFLSHCLYCNESIAFDEEYFLNGYIDFDHLPPGNQRQNLKEVKTKDGTVIYLYSKEEVKLAKRLNKLPWVKHIRSGTLRIPYQHKGKKHTYYPDLFVYTTNHRIIIIEVKALYEMADKLVQKKYYFLKRYCKEHGLIAYYGDASFNGQEDTLKTVVPVDFELYVLEKLADKGYFTRAEFDAYKKGKKKPTYYYDKALVHICFRYDLTFKYSASKKFNFSIRGIPKGLTKRTKDIKGKRITLSNGEIKIVRYDDYLREADFLEGQIKIANYLKRHKNIDIDKLKKAFRQRIKSKTSLNKVKQNVD